MKAGDENIDDPFEDELIALLADYEEQLLAGSGPDLSAHADAPHSLQPRLERARTMLELLAGVDPADTPRGPTAETLDGIKPSFFPNVPRRVDRFEIQRELGHGGCGIVYLAYDPKLRREVALKIPLTGALVTQQMRDRFLREAWASAGLDHPNVIPVFEAGHDGLACYIASAYCRGPTLAEWLKEQERPVPADQAAKLVAMIADGVQHAHERGVYHRDLKPGNVMLDPRDSRGEMEVAPTTQFDFVPRITDFGLAKLQEDGIEQTQSGVLVGTASYMAPEQALGKGDVDARADVYALGGILYELLVGRPPFVGETQLDTLDQVRRHEPIALRRLRPTLPRDLETVCLKCLQKDAARRYPSAQALRLELQCCIEGRPISARPVGRWEHAWRWSLRNRTLAVLGLSVVVLLIALLVTSVGMSFWLNRERINALRTMATMHAVEADATRKSGRAGQRFEALESVRRAVELGQRTGLDPELRRQLRNTAIEALALADLRVAATHSMDHPLDEVEFNSELSLYASPSGNGTLDLVDMLDGQRRAILPTSRRGALSRLRFSPDGKWLAALQSKDASYRIHVWNLSDDDLARITISDAADAALDLRDDGLVAFVHKSGDLVLYDAVTESEAGRVPQDSAPDGCRFSPSGEQLAVWHNSIVRRLETATGAVLAEYSHSRSVRIQCVAWHPDEELLASGGSDFCCYVWNTSSSDEPRHKLTGHAGWVKRVLFDPTGELLISSAKDGHLRVWNPWLGQLLLIGDGHARQFNRDGDHLAGVVGNKVVHWQLAAGRELRTLHCVDEPNYEVDLGSISADGSLLATGGFDGLRLWAVPSGAHLSSVDVGETWLCAFDSDRRRLLTASADGLNLWTIDYDAHIGKATTELASRIDFPEASLPACAAVSWNGRVVAAMFEDSVRVIHLDDSSRPNLLKHQGLEYLAVSPNGRWVATLGPSSIRVWESKTCELVHELAVDSNSLAFEFDPQRRWLVVATAQECSYWSVDSWKRAGRSKLDARFGPPADLAFSADGSIAAVARAGFQIELVDLENWHVVATLPGRLRNPWVCFDPVRNQLYCGGKELTIECWNLPLIRQGLRQLALDWE